MAATGYTPIQLYYSTTAAAVPTAGNLASGELGINITDGKLYYKNNSGVVTLLASTAGAAGDVVGPASATDNAVARFDATTGKLIQNSVGLLSDAGVLTGLTGLTSSGSITFSSLTSGRVTYAGTGGLLTDSSNLQFDGTNLSVGIAPSAGVQLYVYAPASTNAEVRIAVPTATQSTYTAYVNTTVTKVGTENSVGGSLASGSSAYATVVSNNQGYPVQVGTNNVIRTTVTSAGNFGVGTPTPSTKLEVVGTIQSSNPTNTVGQTADVVLNTYNTNFGATNTATLQSVLNDTTTGANDFFIKQFNHGSGSYSEVVLRANSGYSGYVSLYAANTERVKIGTTEVVFNDVSGDVDFRVESDANTHALFVDAGNSTVGINTSTSLAGVDLAVNDVVRITGAAPELRIDVGSGGYYLQLTEEYIFPKSIGHIRSVAGASYEGQLQFSANIGAGSYIQLALMDSTFGTVFNEGGADLDFRVESDTNTHALFVDAGSNTVGILSDTIDTSHGTRAVQIGSAAGVNTVLTISAGVDNTNDRFATLLLRNTGNGGATNRLIYGVNDSTPSTGNIFNIMYENPSTGIATTQAKFTSSEIVLNDDSLDQDFRVESDTNTHALFVDAGNSRVGVNNSNPSVPLDVTGIVRIGYQLNQSSPVQNTWYDIISSMVDNSSFQVSLFAIKGSNEEFAIYQTLQVIGSLFSNTRTAYYIVGSGSGLEYRVLNNFPSPNSLQVRVTASGVSALRASVLQMGG